jgi:dTDP-4-amino-4,6-dideoxygalactose transaminase
MASSASASIAVTAVPFLDLVSQHAPLEDEIVQAIRSALRSGTFIGGLEVTSFEQEFARYVGAPDCVAVNSGTDALRFAYMALGTRPGDEVITVAHTFIATTEALTQAGASIRFVDVDPSTMTMDPVKAREAIGPRTVGIVPVHLYGQPADMDPLLKLAAERGPGSSRTLLKRTERRTRVARVDR